MPRGVIVWGDETEEDVTLFVRCDDGLKRSLTIDYRAPEAKFSKVVRFMIDRGIYHGIEFTQGEKVKSSDLEPSAIEVAPKIAFMDFVFDGKEPIAVSLLVGDQMSIFINAPFMETKGSQKAFDSAQGLVEAVNASISRMDPDVVAGWELERNLELWTKVSRRFGARFPNARDSLDLKWRYERQIKPLSPRFNDVAVDEGFVSDIDQAIELSDAIDSYHNGDFSLLASYSQQNVKWSSRVEGQYGFLNYLYGLKKAVGVPSLNYVLYGAVNSVEITIMRVAHQRGITIPIVKKAESRESYSEESYTGGFILDPPTGVFDDVAVLDFSRFYPSIMIDFNISPETAIVTRYDPVHPEVKFTFERTGLIPESIKVLNGYRNKIEGEIKKLGPNDPRTEKIKAERTAVKGVTNAFYGALGYDRFFLHEKGLASKTAELAREGINEVIEEARRKGHKVYYADTDSCLLGANFEEALKLSDELTDHIQQYFKKKYGLPQDRSELKLKLDQYAKSVLFLGVKKNYAKWVTWENGRTDKIEIVGLARRNRSRFSLRFMEEFYALVLRKEPVFKIQEFIADSCKRIREETFDDIAIHTNIIQDLGAYKVKSAHVRAVEFSNRVLGTNFRRGDVVKLLWIKGYPGYPDQNIVAFEREKQIPRDIKIDWDHMEEVSISTFSEPILEILGKKKESTQKTLF
jgi:DNA polymerase elongation subunit (family B)